MADCKHNFVYDYQLGEAVCQKCGYVLTKEDKASALEYGLSKLREDEQNG
nr:TFIIB-type zinc ribbon-containing protein [uncultured Dysosmobacter sp.]